MALEEEKNGYQVALIKQDGRKPKIKEASTDCEILSLRAS